MDSKGAHCVLLLQGCLLLSCCTWAGSISLSTDIENPELQPDPNQVITIYIHSDTPLVLLDIRILINGDATITEVMNATNCTEYGWQSDYTPECIINADQSVQFTCYNGSGNSFDTVGYFKFRCNSGRVSVYIDSIEAFTFNWVGDFTYSTEPIAVGQWILPPLNDYNEPEPVLVQGPAYEDDFSWEDVFSYAPEPVLYAAASSQSQPEKPVIDIDYDITTNQVWTADKVYRLCDPNGVNVQALLVIEPGTTVIIAYQCAMFINNGGCLIAEGTPNAPITFTPDYLYLEYPEAVGHYWSVFQMWGYYYYTPIRIESTASPATTVRHCMIEGAFQGIVTENIRLDNPIEHNILSGNTWGIFEDGPKLTDIRNNLIHYSQVAAIDVLFCPDPNAVSDTATPFIIEQNTCDMWQYRGIALYGVSDPNNAFTVYILNNIVSNSWQDGIYINDWVKLLVVNTGYFNNRNNKNEPFPEYNPIFAATSPYRPEQGISRFHHHYLNEDSVFVNAGTEYIEQTSLVGTTTHIDGFLDKDLVDIGFHHFGWDYVGGGGLAGTDFSDFLEMADYWLTYTPYEPNSPAYLDPNLVDPNTIHYGGDWNNDGFVDLADFAILSADWQRFTCPVPTPLLFDQEPNAITGELTITLDTLDPQIYEAWLWMDGQLLSTFSPDGDSPGEITITTNDYRNGPHEFKLAYLYGEHLFTSPATEVVFQNIISSIVQPQGFVYGQDYRIAGITEGNCRIKLYDEITETMTYIADCNDGFTLSIPASAMPTDSGIYRLSIEPQSEDEKFDYIIGQKFTMDDPFNDRKKIVISIGSKGLEKAKADCWKHAIRAAIRQNMRPAFLRYKDCTWQNLRFCLNLENVKMWYHVSHGYDELLFQPKRQCIQTKDGLVFSYLKKDYPVVPANYKSLSFYYENNHSLAELRYAATDKLIWVQFNACRSAASEEFPYVLGILPYYSTDPFGKQVFIGWKRKSPVYDIVQGYNQFEADYWEELSFGSSLKKAIEDSIPPNSTGILDNISFSGINDWQYVHFHYPSIIN